MNKTNFILSFCLMMALSTVAKESESRQLFDFGWTFTKIVNGQSSTAQTVNLPHDWDIYAGPNPGKGATGTGGGWYEGGIGEYGEGIGQRQPTEVSDAPHDLNLCFTLCNHISRQTLEIIVDGQVP